MFKTTCTQNSIPEKESFEYKNLENSFLTNEDHSQYIGDIMDELVEEFDDPKEYSLQYTEVLNSQLFLDMCLIHNICFKNLIR